jgi:hypothetical protein
MSDDLERLARLHENGALNVDEYIAAKERLLGAGEYTENRGPSDDNDMSWADHQGLSTEAGTYRQRGHEESRGRPERRWGLTVVLVVVALGVGGVVGAIVRPISDSESVSSKCEPMLESLRASVNANMTSVGEVLNASVKQADAMDRAFEELASWADNPTDDKALDLAATVGVARAAKDDMVETIRAHPIQRLPSYSELTSACLGR